MAKLSDFGIKGCGQGLLLPHKIAGELPEDYARRCELDKIRHRDEDAEIEYQRIRDHYHRKYWSLTESLLKPLTCTSAKRT